MPHIFFLETACESWFPPAGQFHIYNSGRWAPGWPARPSLRSDFITGDTTMRNVFRVTITLGMLAAAARLTAQAPDIKPGPEHEGFKEAEGTWDATVKSKGGEAKGTAVYKVGLNGLWLLEQFKGDLGGMPFEGLGAMSYDPAKKKYVHVWIDSMITRPMTSEGSWDQATKTMTLTGEMPMPGGKSMPVTMATAVKDADTKVFTLTAAGPDGKQMEIMQITYKRRAK
jgi:Protein of unknown function (DUF1579)